MLASVLGDCQSIVLVNCVSDCVKQLCYRGGDIDRSGSRDRSRAMDMLCNTCLLQGNWGWGLQIAGIGFPVHSGLGDKLFYLFSFSLHNFIYFLFPSLFIHIGLRGDFRSCQRRPAMLELGVRKAMETRQVFSGISGRLRI